MAEMEAQVRNSKEDAGLLIYHEIEKSFGAGSAPIDWAAPLAQAWKHRVVVTWTG
jgi:hypothetical protein